MKEKILTLIIGILIGAVITTGIFMIFKNNTENNMRDNMQKGQMKERPSMNKSEIEKPQNDIGTEQTNTTNNANV